MTVAELAKMTVSERFLYERSLKNYRDLRNIKATYFEEGMAKGLEKAKVDVAISARVKGLSIEIIADITSITKQELLQLFSEKGI